MSLHFWAALNAPSGCNALNFATISACDMLSQPSPDMGVPSSCHFGSFAAESVAISMALGQASGIAPAASGSTVTSVATTAR
ncbi:Uncharacterised protein [Mycobacteroides abscessus subsp. abscessus]|nr:Uncharacterised protein [Mycobacteroides abscessus subsp. abscessus]